MRRWAITIVTGLWLGSTGDWIVHREWPEAALGIGFTILGVVGLVVLIAEERIEESAKRLVPPEA